MLVLLGIVALGASAFMSEQAHRWAERDLTMRAQVILAGAREGLADRLGRNERSRAVALLEELVRDERLLGAAVCGSKEHPIASTKAFPRDLKCDSVAPGSDTSGSSGVFHLVGGTVHMSVLPIVDDGGATIGRLALVHDMSYVDWRASETRMATFLVFAVVGLLAAGATVLASRFSWVSWTNELRRHLAAPLRSGLGSTSAPQRAFIPVLSDVRELVQRLTSEESSAAGGRWTPERLRGVLRSRLHGEGVVVVANREPYIHERMPDHSVRVVYPASGLVTAIEPVMRACSGTWIAHGSGTADHDTVDAHDRLRVPPGDEAYNLRRLWLTEDEERGYYYGFANEGLWPLCHIAHARPEFRSEDFEQYQRVNLRFARAVVEEATVPDPIVLVQDYHFALLPRMLRELLPRATIITFWHIPWPNAERYGICPWARELMEGLLGSSILGFHTQAHCNNFMESADRYLEARIDWERQAVVMAGRETLVRPYPISIEWPNHWVAAAPSVAECRQQGPRGSRIAPRLPARSRRRSSRLHEGHPGALPGRRAAARALSPVSRPLLLPPGCRAQPHDDRDVPQARRGRGTPGGADQRTIRMRGAGADRPAPPPHGAWRDHGGVPCRRLLLRLQSPRRHEPRCEGIRERQRRPPRRADPESIHRRRTGADRGARGESL